MTRAFAIPILAFALAGCSRSKPEAPAEPDTVEAVAEPSPTPIPVPIAPPGPTPSPTASPTPEPPPAEDVGANEQMLDDASATGMTARANREEDAGEPAVADPEAQ